jgi:peptidoglycan hydrolase-like protein with peptidoglycan-binding domain
MYRKRLISIVTFVTVFSIISSFSSVTASAAEKMAQTVQIRVLKNGMQGSDVTSLQKKLKQLGLLDSEATGYYGDQTEDAVRQLQKRYELTSDGASGLETLALVNRLAGGAKQTVAVSAGENNSIRVLKPGTEGKDVTALQKKLLKLGFLKLEPTGYYGDLTEVAVEKLQTRYKLKSDGVAGLETLALADKLCGTVKQSEKEMADGTKGNIKMLKPGDEGKYVTDLQKKLRKLGFLNCEPTGQYRELTKAAVKKLQGRHKLEKDGIAGVTTLALVDKLILASSVPKKTTVTASRNTAAKTLASRGVFDRKGFLIPWFNGVEDIFEDGMTTTIYDIDSGLSFKAKRTYGYNHADCEPLTAEDTKIMKEIYGGEWSWSRRAVIVTVAGRKIAASMAGMPHAGLESKAANTYVRGRSSGYGSGINLDAVKGNSMSGHFDLHFLGSKTHGSNRVDENHQEAVKRAAEWAKENLGTEE